MMTMIQILFGGRRWASIKGRFEWAICLEKLRWLREQAAD
jgi:hypothetical protein